MKNGLISIAKFVGLHMLVGLLYVISLNFIDYNDLWIYKGIEPEIVILHIWGWIEIGFLDTLMTLAIIGNFNIFKGKFQVIKTWFAWIIGIVIAYYSCHYIVMIYWIT